MGESEKRRHARLSFKAPLHYRIRGEAKAIDTSTENISLGGVGFTHDRYIPPKTYLMLEFNILQKAIYPVARVAWANSMPYSHKYRFGVEFSEIDPQSKKDLKDFCALRISL